MSKKLEDFLNTGSVPESAPSIVREISKLESLLETPENLPESYIVGVGYDGEKRQAFLKLYEPNLHRIFLWYDDTGHKPYCLAQDQISALEANQSIVRHMGFERFEQVKKYDALRDEEIQLVRIVAKDPLAIGGRAYGSIRDMIKAWEADIKYVENYIYDRSICPGMPYQVKKGKLVRVDHKLPSDMVHAVEKLLGKESEDYQRLALEWIRLLECPVPEFYRASLDIEVAPDIATRMPDASVAEQPIICVSVADSEGKKQVFLLKRSGVNEDKEKLPKDAEIHYFEKEEGLISSLFVAISSYPIIITFNGDDFDLRYLWNRAQLKAFNRQQIPVEMGRETATTKNGIHIDLYKFFFNRSIQIYAFGQKYRENTLDEIGTALLGVGKIPIEKTVSELSYGELASYCLRDAEVTLSLTEFKEDLVMKLIAALSRISFMSFEDVSRQGVSNWIRSTLYNEHRRRNFLIPRADDIIALKGTTSTEAVIKGKKYKGAIVVEPTPGIHFSVAVLDFASLYPSIIKVWNLGYETIRCPHKDAACKDNKVPGTPHWVCKKNRALESLLIGSLRDLRVNWYKPRSKDKTLSDDVRSLYNVIQNALKVILNASYGVFGSDRFALYCPPVAEATAAIGRYAITSTIEKAHSTGMTVVYGDTDSIFLGNPSPEQLNELIDWSRSFLKMELEVDKRYRYLVLSSRKKNYLGVFPDGSVDIKGLTGKKRHIPEFLKRVFYEMIEILSKVQSTEEFEEAKTKIKGIVKNCYLMLRDRRFKLEDLAFNVMISKSPNDYTKTTPQHVKAAEILSDHGTEVRAGDLISFVKVLGESGVKPVQLATVEEVDTGKYIEYLESTFEQVLDALGTDFQELAGTKKLESFLGD